MLPSGLRAGALRTGSWLAALLFVCADVSVVHAQRSFKTPEAAANTLVRSVRDGDVPAILAVLGRDGVDIVSSGDAVADAAARRRFVEAYDARHQLVQNGEAKAIMVVGAQEFPFSIPIVRDKELWHFDPAAGRQEILYRRIGENEYAAMQACLAYVDAQIEYAERNPAGEGMGAYAQRLASDPGKKNGLYWPASSGEDDSPLGSLVAQASASGYALGRYRVPFHGYYYRVLTRQGASAPGGVLNYVVNGKMIGGFGLLAYPATYGISGVKTFLVNRDGIIFEKNLGPSTSRIARRILSFDPDATWQKAVDTTPPPVALHGAGN